MSGNRLRNSVASDVEDSPASVPGPLRSIESPRLILHTVTAQQLFYGRYQSGRPPIVGVLQFAKRLNQIDQAASAKNSLAEAVLRQIDEALRDAEARIRQADEELQAEMEAGLPIKVPIALSTEPVELTLNFSSPLAYRGAYLISRLDGYVSRLLAASHYGLFDRNIARQRKGQTGRWVRKALLSPMAYKAT